MQSENYYTCTAITWEPLYYDQFIIWNPKTITLVQPLYVNLYIITHLLLGIQRPLHGNPCIMTQSLHGIQRPLH